MSEKDHSHLAIPFTYGELVDYQTDSIVSRTIINKKHGSVTIFAFDRGQKLSEHTEPFDALLEIVEGKAVVTIDGTDYEVFNGQQIIMPANVPHAVRAEEKFKMVLVMIKANK